MANVTRMCRLQFKCDLMCCSAVFPGSETNQKGGSAKALHNWSRRRHRPCPWKLKPVSARPHPLHNSPGCNRLVYRSDPLPTLYRTHINPHRWYLLSAISVCCEMKIAGSSSCERGVCMKPHVAGHKSAVKRSFLFDPEILVSTLRRLALSIRPPFSVGYPGFTSSLASDYQSGFCYQVTRVFPVETPGLRRHLVCLFNYSSPGRHRLEVTSDRCTDEVKMHLDM